MVNKIYNDVQSLKKPKTRSLEEININAYRVPNYASLKFGEEGGWENIKEDCFVWRGEGQGRWQLLSRIWGGVLRAEAACHSLLGPEESSELRGEFWATGPQVPLTLSTDSLVPGGAHWGEGDPGLPSGQLPARDRRSQVCSTAAWNQDGAPVDTFLLMYPQFGGCFSLQTLLFPLWHSAHPANSVSRIGMGNSKK